MMSKFLAVQLRKTGDVILLNVSDIRRVVALESGHELAAGIEVRGARSSGDAMLELCHTFRDVSDALEKTADPARVVVWVQQ